MQRMLHLLRDTLHGVRADVNMECVVSITWWAAQLQRQWPRWAIGSMWMRGSSGVGIPGIVPKIQRALRKQFQSDEERDNMCAANGLAHWKYVPELRLLHAGVPWQPFPVPLSCTPLQRDVLPFLGQDGHFREKWHPVLHEEHGRACGQQQITEAFPRRAELEEVVEV